MPGTGPKQGSSVVSGQRPLGCLERSRPPGRSREIHPRPQPSLQGIALPWVAQGFSAGAVPTKALLNAPPLAFPWGEVQARDLNYSVGRGMGSNTQILPGLEIQSQNLKNEKLGL